MTDYLGLSITIPLDDSIRRHLQGSLNIARRDQVSVDVDLDAAEILSQLLDYLQLVWLVNRSLSYLRRGDYD